MRKIWERAWQIITSPRGTWQTIKSENVAVKDLIANYAAPLALIPAVCGFIGITIIGIRMPAGNLARAPFYEAFFGGILSYVLTLAGVYVGGWAVNHLAQFFNSKSDCYLRNARGYGRAQSAWWVSTLYGGGGRFGSVDFTGASVSDL